MHKERRRCFIDFCLQTGETRVWRTYVGGARLNEWHGRKAEQGFFPEDWAASTTRAVNAGREDLVEGLSRVVSMPDQPYLLDLIQKDPEAFFGKAHLQAFGAQAGFLVKLIDAQERLTIQVHPDQQYAKTVLHSDYGKTESWYVLGGDDHGKKPCIYIGFKPDITREKWKELFETQNIEGMLNCLHRVTVEPGDCFIIKGGVPHAIGAGCFLVEIQEPTDYTIRVERTTPSGFAVADSMCHQGLGFEKMFECFHYEPHSREEIHDRWFIEPETVLKTAGGSITTLVGYRNTPLFRLDEANVSDTLTVDCPPRGSGIYVLEGAGTLSANGRSLPLKKTDQLFVPAGTGRFTLDAEAPLRVLHFFGPEEKQ